MEMSGERRIPAPRERVWDALNDPAVLKSCIPGCDSLERTGENELTAAASVKIGPIAAKFGGKIRLNDLNPPTSYTIEGEGQGGVAGFAKGGAEVRLADDGADTLLSYDVKAQVGGKIAQLGARLIDATAKSMADQFFDRFTAHLSPAPAVEATPETIVDMTQTATGTVTQQAQPAAPRPAAAPSISIFDLIPAEPYGYPIVAWIGGAAFLFVLFLIFGT